MYYEKYINSVPRNSGWASDEALAGSVGCLEGSWDTVPDEGGVVLFNHGGKLIYDGGDECRHVLVVGATGTGKSRLVILPSLLHSLRAKARRSFVVFDVKGELEACSVETALKNGYEVININFRNPSVGNSWNPFYRANALYKNGSRQAAWKLVEDIIASIFVDGKCTTTDPFWRTNSANLFRAICHVLWENGKELSFKDILALGSTIPVDEYGDSNCKLFQMAGMNEYNIDDIFPKADKSGDSPDKPSPTADKNGSDAAKRLLAGYRNAAEKTRGNILCCYEAYLATITARDDVIEMISAPNPVNFHTLGEKPTVLYVTLPDDTTALGALQGILLTQLMQELNECARDNNGCLPVRTEMYLDELCNIKPAIPSLETALTISRSRGIRYILAIQSYAQLCGVYGAAAETIAANCSTWIALNISKDETFRDKLSRLCGCNSAGNPLITPAQLALLEYEQAIVIRERCAPYFARLEDVGNVMERLQPKPARKTQEAEKPESIPGKETAAPAGVKPGDALTHKIYGEGVVERIEGSTLIIRFQRAGEKKLSMRWCLRNCAIAA